MNRYELLKEIEKSFETMKIETKEGFIKGCLILIREGKVTEIQIF